MSTLDADALATLTPEEREAIEGHEYSDADLAALKKVTGDGGDDDANDDDGDDDNGDDDGDDNDQHADSTPPPNAPDADDDEPDSSQSNPKTSQRYEAKLPSDYDTQIKSLKERDAELRQQFKDGEIDIDERDAGLAELADQREQLVVQRAKAEISQEMAQQNAAQQWQATVNTFMARAAKEAGGFDYRKDTAKAEDLDTFVKMLANKQENADKPMDWFLSEAHKRVQALHGVTPRRETVADATARRKPPVDAAPRTLAQVPGSDGPGDVAGEFADIEALDGEAYEDAIARMSKTQRDKFLRGR